MTEYALPPPRHQVEQLEHLCGTQAGETIVGSGSLADCRAGAALFMDRRLSFDGSLSCGDCHLTGPASAQDVGKSPGRAVGFPIDVLRAVERSRPLARGKEIPGPRVPSLIDIGRRPHGGRYFWNGRAPSRTAAVYWPLFAPEELGATAESLAPFGGADLVAQRIGSFLSQLVAPDSPWDRYNAGDPSALTGEMRRGYEVFRAAGCGTAPCHGGQDLRSDTLVSVLYKDLPADLFSVSEATYLSDYELHGTWRPTVTLQTVPPTLRNLALRGPPWGRFGQTQDLGVYLSQHCSSLKLDAPSPCQKQALDSAAIAALKPYLLEGLRSGGASVSKGQGQSPL